MSVPEPGGGVSTGRIVPVYPLTAGLAQKSMRGFSRQALDLALGSIEEYLPDEVRLTSEGALLPLRDAIAQVHYPDDESSLQAAKERLAFDDLFLLQLGLVLRKRERKAYDGIPIQSDEDVAQAVGRVTAVPAHGHATIGPGRDSRRHEPAEADGQVAAR